MELASTGLFRAKWTDEIQDEWISNLLGNRPTLSRKPLERTKELMTQAVPDCLVRGYEVLIPSLDLPDPDDRHVLAAAIHCKAAVIITYNLKDFPPAKLVSFDIEPQHPDEFLFHQFDLNQPAFLKSVRAIRARLKYPEKTAEEYLETLAAQSLPQTVELLRAYVDLI